MPTLPSAVTLSASAPPTPLEARREYGKLKVEQIKRTGADYCVTVCHNCHSQMIDINTHYNAGYHSVHLWTLIALSLGVLSENEREYLDPDLQDVNVLEIKTE